MAHCSWSSWDTCSSRCGAGSVDAGRRPAPRGRSPACPRVACPRPPSGSPCRPLRRTSWASWFPAAAEPWSWPNLGHLLPRWRLSSLTSSSRWSSWRSCKPPTNKLLIFFWNSWLLLGLKDVLPTSRKYEKYHKPNKMKWAREGLWEMVDNNPSEIFKSLVGTWTVKSTNW